MATIHSLNIAMGLVTSGVEIGAKRTVALVRGLKADVDTLDTGGGIRQITSDLAQLKPLAGTLGDEFAHTAKTIGAAASAGTLLVSAINPVTGILAGLSVGVSIISQMRAETLSAAEAWQQYREVVKDVLTPFEDANRIKISGDEASRRGVERTYREMHNRRLSDVVGGGRAFREQQELAAETQGMSGPRAELYRLRRELALTPGLSKKERGFVLYDLKAAERQIALQEAHEAKLKAITEQRKSMEEQGRARKEAERRRESDHARMLADIERRREAIERGREIRAQRRVHDALGLIAQRQKLDRASLDRGGSDGGPAHVLGTREEYIARIKAEQQGSRNTEKQNAQALREIANATREANRWLQKLLSNQPIPMNLP